MPFIRGNINNRPPEIHDLMTDLWVYNDALNMDRLSQSVLR
jgi:hypothetical protein